jgi:hypothetical protein
MDVINGRARTMSRDKTPRWENQSDTFGIPGSNGVTMKKNGAKANAITP